jgi:hypothetical protein
LFGIFKNLPCACRPNLTPAFVLPRFEAQFGLSWTDALATGRVFNALDGCKDLGITADQMDTEWGKCKKAGKMVKFGGGFYCG